MRKSCNFQRGKNNQCQAVTVEQSQIEENVNKMIPHLLLSVQVPGERLADAELDRAAGQPSKRQEDPDPQPECRDQLRVPGDRHQRVRGRDDEPDRGGQDER